MQSASYSGEIRGGGHMMRHETEEEKKLWAKYRDVNTSEEEKRKILERLRELDREITKNSPFHYD